MIDNPRKMNKDISCNQSSTKAGTTKMLITSAATTAAAFSSDAEYVCLYSMFEEPENQIERSEYQNLAKLHKRSRNNHC